MPASARRRGDDYDLPLLACLLTDISRRALLDFERPPSSRRCFSISPPIYFTRHGQPRKRHHSL